MSITPKWSRTLETISSIDSSRAQVGLDRRQIGALLPLLRRSGELGETLGGAVDCRDLEPLGEQAQDQLAPDASGGAGYDRIVRQQQVFINDFPAIDSRIDETPESLQSTDEEGTHFRLVACRAAGDGEIRPTDCRINRT
jgi:hypothetical protein